MKLLIFLLLLSASCLGQNCPPPERLCFPNKKPMDTIDLKAQGGLVKHPVKCSHKWVELHQDTVSADVPQNSVPAILMQRIYPEFEESVPLVCLICHKEKKKVIHYKR